MSLPSDIESVTEYMYIQAHERSSFINLIGGTCRGIAVLFFDIN